MTSNYLPTCPPPVLAEEDVKHFMKLCIAIAYDAMAVQEVPVSAMYVHIPTRTILSASFNQTVVKKNGIRHCEVECLYQLESKVKHCLIQGYKGKVNNIMNDQSSITTTNSLPTLTQTKSHCNSLPLTFQQSIDVLRPYLTPGDDKCVLKQEDIDMLMDFLMKHDQQVINFVPLSTFSPNTSQSPNDTNLQSTPQQGNKATRLNLHRSRALLSILTRSICHDVACIVSVEPCIMCTGVLTTAGVKTVYAGCGNEKFGGCGSIINSHHTYPHAKMNLVRSPSGFKHVCIDDISLNKDGHDDDNEVCDGFNPPQAKSDRQEHLTVLQKESFDYGPQLAYHQGIMKEEAIQALQTFYLRGNPNAPAEKRQRPLMQPNEHGE